ncbi:MAG: hypothetical protein WCI53_11895 [Bacteroidota bacterium]
MRNIYLSLLSLLGLGALFGGGVLIISPSGKLFGIPITMLANSPFHNFLIPGIILFTFIGLIPLTVIYALKKKSENKLAELFNFYKDMFWGWTFSIYIAFSLIIWIQMEMYYLQSVHWSHNLYMFWAIAIIFFALMPQVRSLYKKEAKSSKYKVES